MRSNWDWYLQARFPKWRNIELGKATLDAVDGSSTGADRATGVVAD
jgi:hypothetical protein